MVMAYELPGHESASRNPENRFAQGRLSYEQLSTAIEELFIDDSHNFKAHVRFLPGLLELFESPSGDASVPRQVDGMGRVTGYSYFTKDTYTVGFDVAMPGTTPGRIELTQEDTDRSRTVRSALTAALRMYVANNKSG
tara:strand:- start:1259 stop:1672 length:414 start_codon:yes stop_codon:yes gene_type:complete